MKIAPLALGLVLASLFATSASASRLREKSDDFVWETSDACAKAETRSGPFSPNVSFHRCGDSTISFIQPETENNGWEGKCGPTSTANLVSMRCQGGSLTVKEVNSFAGDLTPGWTPRTLIYALNTIFTKYRATRRNTSSLICPSGHWEEIGSINGADFIYDLRKSIVPRDSMGSISRRRENGSRIQMSPIPVFLEAGITGMHWVTLVDMLDDSSDAFGCSVRINTYGEQETLSCSRFVHYANTLLGFIHGRFVK